MKLKCVALWPILSEKDLPASGSTLVNMAHFYHVPDSMQFDPDNPPNKCRSIEEWSTPCSPRASDSDEYHHHEIPEGEEEEYYEWKCRVDAYKEEKIYQHHLVQ